MSVTGTTRSSSFQSTGIPPRAAEAPGIRPSSDPSAGNAGWSDLRGHVGEHLVQAIEALGHAGLHAALDHAVAILELLDVEAPRPDRVAAGQGDLAQAVSRLRVARVALKRGPLIYCVEQEDNPELTIGRLRLPRTAPLRDQKRDDLFEGIVCVAADCRSAITEDWKGDLYRTAPPRETPSKMTAVPYYLWNNRGPGRMVVWIPED